MVDPEGSPLFQSKKATKCDSTIAYRTWPIFLLSFTRLFFISIFERAFLNYLYFTVDINESILGFISSATAAAYIIGPLVGQFITSKLGIRNSIILSSISTPILMGAQMLYFDPLYLISIRILSGISLGVYWPNCYNLLSRWQSVSNEEKSNRNFKQFNFSWNLGFILGLLFGYLWALTLNEYITMTIAFFLSFLLLPFSLFLKKNSELNHLGEKTINIEQYNIKLNSDVNLRKVPKQKSNNHMIVYPILFSWLTLFVYAASKSIFRFSYPVFLKSFGSPSYFAYLIQLSIQIGQLIGLTWSNSMKIYYRKVSVFTSLIMIVFSSFAIIITQNLLYISIISASIGLFIGLIQGASLKIMIDYGAERNTKKYSTTNEVLKGIGFGLTPIFAGFVAEINIYAIFIFLIIFIFSVFIPIIYLSRNIKKKHID